MDIPALFWVLSLALPTWGYWAWSRSRAAGGWESSRQAGDGPVYGPPPTREFEADVGAVEADVVGRSHDSIYLEGVGLLQPFIIDDAFPLDPQRLGRGLALVEHVVRLNPANWVAMWALGRGYRRAGSLVRSHDFFARAYALVPDQLAAVVEYQHACLLLGRTDEALSLAHRQVALAGGNADARSNLAVALLLHGDLDAADAESAAAAALAPDDTVIRNVRRVITDVREGRRAQPRSLPEFEVPVSSPPPDGLTPEEARRAFEEAFTAYRVLLEADLARVVSPEERPRLELATGTIERVEIRASAVDLTWVGRTLHPCLTERTTVVGPRGTLSRESRLRMRIEARLEGWRVVQSWLFPPLGRPDGRSHTVEPASRTVQ